MLSFSDLGTTVFASTIALALGFGSGCNSQAQRSQEGRKEKPQGPRPTTTAQPIVKIPANPVLPAYPKRPMLSKKLAIKVIHTFMVSEMLKEHPGIVRLQPGTIATVADYAEGG